MTFDQSGFDVRCEWGENGIRHLAPGADAVIIVEATAFIRDCGATTGFSPQVHLRRTGRKMAAAGNVFIGNHSNEIKILWLSANELEISASSEVVH